MRSVRFLNSLDYGEEQMLNKDFDLHFRTTPRRCSQGSPLVAVKPFFTI